MVNHGPFSTIWLSQSDLEWISGGQWIMHQNPTKTSVFFHWKTCKGRILINDALWSLSERLLWSLCQHHPFEEVSFSCGNLHSFHFHVFRWSRFLSVLPLLPYVVPFPVSVLMLVDRIWCVQPPYLQLSFVCTLASFYHGHLLESVFK